VKRLARRAVLVLAMVTSLGLVAPVVAVAVDRPHATIPTPLQQYRAQLRIYNHQLLVINQNYHFAIITAQTVEMARLRVAKTAARKSLIRADYHEAVLAATTKWQNALAALGNPPLPPAPNHPTTTTTQPQL
jgi:hypothetical protein